MRLTEYLSVQRIRVPLQAGTKEGVIEELLDAIEADGWLSDRNKALRAVLDREKVRTTGIGHGLAIPHGKTAAVRDIVMALGKTDGPVDFDSADGRPVDLVVLLLSPIEKTGLHIQALARIARLMTVQAVRDGLLEAGTPGELHARLTLMDDLAP